MGIRQKESEFEYVAKMEFNPKSNQAEAGISIFQQDDNYINFTVEKVEGATVLKLIVKGRKEDTKTIKQQVLSDYKGCLLYTSPSPRDQRGSRMPSSA